jgi:hypothetical protein
MKPGIIENMDQRFDPRNPLEGENDMAKIWAARERESPTPEAYEKSLAGQWRELGCAAVGAPYVVRALLARLDILGSSRMEDLGSEVPKLAAAFLDKDCPGARGLTNDEIAKLKEIAAKPPPPAPKQ